MGVDESRRQKKLMKRRQKHKLRRKNQAGSIHFELLMQEKRFSLLENFPFMNV